MSRVLAMILAGGRGKRMDVLCHERPKPDSQNCGQQNRYSHKSISMSEHINVSALNKNCSYSI